DPLVFSPDTTDHQNLLHAYEIFDLPLVADLAVLSACHSGEGPWENGEGYMSLSRAFRYAGCPNIVMSLWQAEDAASQQIMREFYAHLSQGMAKHEALRQAKLNYLAHGHLTHPFFWAGYVMVGDAQALPQTFAWEQWALGLGMLLLGILLVLGIRNRRLTGRRSRTSFHPSGKNPTGVSWISSRG
ncbi:MAG: CHAT domain-containing protein, partial [Bacteroidota bacterium]